MQDERAKDKTHALSGAEDKILGYDLSPTLSSKEREKNSSTNNKGNKKIPPL